MPTKVIPLAEFDQVPLFRAVGQFQELLEREGGGKLKIRLVEKPDSLPHFKKQTSPPPDIGSTPFRDRTVSARISRIPAGELLRFLASQVGARILLVDDEVILYPDIGTTDPLVVVEYRAAGDGEGDYRHQFPGILFYEGGYARRVGNKVMVCTTQEQHDVIRSWVD